MRSLPALGLGLSLVGGLLDFVSGTAIVQGDMTVAPMMTTTVNQTAVVWTLVLYSMGAIIVITGILGASSAGMKRMKRIGALMGLYGLVMISVGGLMYGGYSPMMENINLSSAGMFAVGILMVLNGALMSRSSATHM